MVHDHEALTPPVPDGAILVVDNSAAILELLDLALQDFGYQVLACQTTTSALECLRSTAPALVILDARFLDSSWSDIFDCIIEDKNLAGPPVLLTVDFPVNQLENRRQVDHYGFEVILKPFDLDELSRTVARLIRPPQALAST